jgi:hypothetical protein
MLTIIDFLFFKIRGICVLRKTATTSFFLRPVSGVRMHHTHLTCLNRCAHLLSQVCSHMNADIEKNELLFTLLLAILQAK